MEKCGECVLFTQEVGGVVGDPASEMLDPEGPAIHGPRLEQSWILLVLDLHFRHVALGRASYRAFHVQHAQQPGPLRNREKSVAIIRFRVGIDRVETLTRDEMRSIQGTLST